LPEPSQGGLEAVQGRLTKGLYILG
jgi:hypothetical protein